MIDGKDGKDILTKSYRHRPLRIPELYLETQKDMPSEKDSPQGRFSKILMAASGALFGLVFVIILPLLGLISAAVLASGKLIGILYGIAGVVLSVLGISLSFGWSPAKPQGHAKKELDK